MNALSIPEALLIADHGTLPNGIDWLTIGYDGSTAEYRKAPAAISFQGFEYGKASHNSDTFRITYRTDARFGLRI